MSKLIGKTYENRALALLEQAGLELIERNVTFRCGEIDLLMRDPLGILVFVEVRARAVRWFGSATDSISAVKKARLRCAARHVLARWRGPWPPCRFDVVAFDGTDCEWLSHVFDGFD
jgi:putative endonuclease